MRPRHSLLLGSLAVVTGLALVSRRETPPRPHLAPSPADPFPSVVVIDSPASIAPPPVRAANPVSTEITFHDLASLAQTDPAAAIDRAHRAGRTDEEKSLWVAELAQQWAQRSPDAAWSWLAQQTQARLRDLATGTLPQVIIDTLAHRDPQFLVHQVDALVRLGETPLGVAPVVAVHLGLEALVATDQLALARRTVESWLASATPLTVGEAAYAAIADALRATDPAAAGRWLTKLPRSAAHDTALVEYPARWAATDPHAALAWTEQHLPTDLRASAVQRSFGDWAERAPLAAGEWLGDYLARVPASPETDKLIGTLVNLGPALQTSPTLALQWTHLITDPAARTAQEERVVLRWATQDTAAARDYLWRSSSLAPDRKNAVARLILQGNPLAAD